MRCFFLLSIFILFSCSSSNKKLTAQQIIDKTILASGADLVENSVISFDFRDKNYKATRNNGKFSLTRTRIIDSVSIKDVISNNGFQRFINNKNIEVLDSMAVKYANSVNSVHYFSVLPFGLNDRAVNKKLLPEVSINGKEYYKIEISFSQDGGGEDFEDVFIYWIDKNSFLIDYLAYKFHVNGGGVRFRELKEQCFKNGIRFVDYNNYKPDNKEIKITDLDIEYEKNQLNKVSEIILANIEVELL